MSLSDRVGHVHLVRRVGRSHAHILSLTERKVAALGALAEALEQRQCGPPKHDDGEEDDDERSGAEDLDHLTRGKLAPLVH